VRPIEELLAERLRAVPGLVAAYLFGSRARGDARAGSDIDVALWLADAPSSFDAYPFELAGELETAVDAPVDVVVLNTAPSDLVHRVLRDGVLLVEHDRCRRVAFEVRARNDYFDLLPMRTAYRRAGRLA
jgi:uncharacterized protein